MSDREVEMGREEAWRGKIVREHWDIKQAGWEGVASKEVTRS